MLYIVINSSNKIEEKIIRQLETTILKAVMKNVKFYKIKQRNYKIAVSSWEVQDKATIICSNICYSINICGCSSLPADRYRHTY